MPDHLTMFVLYVNAGFHRDFTSIHPPRPECFHLNHSPTQMTRASSMYIDLLLRYWKTTHILAFRTCSHKDIAPQPLVNMEYIFFNPKLLPMYGYCVYSKAGLYLIHEHARV